MYHRLFAPADRILFIGGWTTTDDGNDRYNVFLATAEIYDPSTSHSLTRGPCEMAEPFIPPCCCKMAWHRPGDRRQWLKRQWLP